MASVLPYSTFRSLLFCRNSHGLSQTGCPAAEKRPGVLCVKQDQRQYRPGDHFHQPFRPAHFLMRFHSFFISGPDDLHANAFPGPKPRFGPSSVDKKNQGGSILGHCGSRRLYFFIQTVHDGFVCGEFLFLPGSHRFLEPYSTLLCRSFSVSFFISSAVLLPAAFMSLLKR